MPRPIIVAHRGLHAEYPENSIEAFVAAWNAGIEWCECDVRYIGYTPVILHDDTLDRTTTGTGPLWKLTKAELQRLRLRTSDGTPTDCRVPTLKAVLDVMPPGCGLVIEFKEIVGRAESFNLWKPLSTHRVMYQSFHAGNLPIFVEAAVASGFAWLLDTQEEIRAAISSPWPALHVNHQHLRHREAKLIRESGKSLGVWTVNDEADLRRVIPFSPKMIITDNPVRAQAIVDQTAAPSVPSSGTPGEG